LFDGIVSNVFNTKFNDLLSYRIQQEDKIREVVKELIEDSKLSYSDQLVSKTIQLLDCLGGNIKASEVRKQH
jgi:hypothetical protein